MTAVDFDARFTSKYEVDGECWIWTASTNGRYPKYWQGRQGFAHRFAWSWVNGPIPNGMEIDHLCQRPLCVNPKHLELVTRAENMRRVAKRRTHCPSGHEYTPENTYAGKGWKQCKTCDRIAHRLPNGDIARAERGECRRGHKLTAENTRIPPSSKTRRCKQCDRIAYENWKKRRDQKNGHQHVHAALSG